MKIPLSVLILDLLGAVLVAGGIADRFAGTALMPPGWRFPGYEMVLICLGVLLMLPLVFHVLRQARLRRS